MKRLNIVNNSFREFPFNEEEPNIEVTDEQYLKIINGELSYKDGQLVENNIPAITKQIEEKKSLLNKYKEDVEQVELFGMARDDYEQKKQMCVELIIELRELEKQVK